LPRLAVAFALALAACARTDSPVPRADGRPWVIATTVDLSGVNELVAPSVRFTHEVLDLLFLGLLDEQADFAERPPSFAPALAERWELSDDRRRLTFTLRADARWSDGRPVTARDVLFSHHAQTSPEVAWVYADSKDAIREVEVVDERTVVYHFAEVYPYQVVDANDGKILPAHVWGEIPFADWRRSGELFRERLVTSGPYRLAAWRPGVELALERHAELAPPRLPGQPERVVFRVLPDPAALVEQLLAGAFDFADGLAPYDAERVARSPRLRLVAADSRQFDYIGWNTRRPPFDDPEIRRALTLAIDRQGLVDTLWRGRARVAAGPIPAIFWARDRELAPWPYDPEAARAILARRGFADRDGDGVVERHGVPFRFELTTNAGNRMRADAAVLVQEQLRRIGVACVPRTLELHALTERNLAGDFDATIAGWAVDTTLDLRPYFHSRSIADGWNFVGWSDPELDELLDRSRTLPEVAATRPLLVRAQRILHEAQPYTFLWEPPRLAAVRRGIDGVEVTPLAALATLPRWTRRDAGR
jgi:peptide/nickel transport system substrate-binding protein